MQTKIYHTYLIQAERLFHGHASWRYNRLGYVGKDTFADSTVGEPKPGPDSKEGKSDSIWQIVDNLASVTQQKPQQPSKKRWATNWESIMSEHERD